MATKERKKILHLVFLSDEGKKVTVRVPDPKENLESAQVLNAMTEIQDKAFFGSWRTEKIDSAKIVETITDQINVEVDFED